MRPSLYNLDYQELKNQIQDWNEPSYRAPQIWQGLYQNYWNNSDDFSTIPVSLRKEIDKIYTLSSLYSERELHSTDGFTRKTLYRLEDNSAIETVLMGYEDRNTVCISSQVGCGVGCNFCATGNMGFIRNLSRAEIIEQVVNTAADLVQEGKSLTNVVFMGMGEPFHNYTQVMEAVRILNDPEGFGMGARRFTISTVGLVPGIKRFTEENSQIKACRKYIQITNRRITFEWALIEGVNDTGEQAQKLSRLIDGMLAHVNLIQLNPVSCYSGKPATKKNALNFQKTLTDSGIACTIRVRRGIDIQAGCGQLASESN